MIFNTLQRFVTMLQCYRHFSTYIQTQTLFVITQNRCNIVTTVLLYFKIIKKKRYMVKDRLKTMLQNLLQIVLQNSY